MTTRREYRDGVDRIQLTTDGHRAYIEAVEQNFGGLIDYATLVKLFGQDPQEDEKRYSPAKCNGCKKEVIMGRLFHHLEGRGQTT